MDTDVEAKEAASSTRKGKWISVLRGPRYVDAPFRVILVLIAVVGLTPSSIEAPDPVYWVFQVVAAILLVAVCFVPVIAGAVGFVLYVAFVLMFPDLVNPFQTVGEAAVAFLLSQLRVRLFILFSLLLFGIILLPTSLGLWGGDREPLLTLAFGWLLAVVLGLVAAGFEKRIQTEISRREDLARTHERKLERMRLDMALDTHDTVSHGLAAGAAIVRMLGVDARLEGRADSKLTELALVNAHTQQQLRVLLSRLTDDPDGHSDTEEFENEMLRAVEMIRSATEAGGFIIDIRIGALPSDVPQKTWEVALFILKELATNIVKHASAPAPCAISVTSHLRDNRAWLHFASSNPASSTPIRAPRSLSARLERIGGYVTISHDHAELTVEAAVPTGAVEPM